MFEIDVQNDDGYTVDAERLVSAARMVLTQQGILPGAALTIVITDNESVAALNRQHRGVDSPTDILSFPADDPPIQIPDEPPYLGDLVIAYPYASAQAAREGHDLQQSLALLVVHGTLHLLDYDHDTLEHRATMWDAQEDALRALNIPVDMLPALEGDPNDDTEDH